MGKAKKIIRRIKKHSRTSPDVQFKEFSLTITIKLDLERTMSELGKPNKKRPLERNENLYQTKN